MKKQPKDSAIGRREFLAATSGLLAAAVPGGEILAHAANSEAPVLDFPAAKASGNLRKIPIGVFDPVYDHLSLDAMLDKVSALGLQFFPGKDEKGQTATGVKWLGGNDRYDPRWMWDRE